MARIDKNGNLRGAIGNIIFVTDGKRTYARSKPAKVRQSAATKAASKVFGTVSEKEKLLRTALMHELGMPPIQYFAAKHRARLQKTIIPSESATAGALIAFGSPEALPGFDFNPQMPWTTCTNFFINVNSDTEEDIIIDIAQLHFGKELKALPGVKSAKVVFSALAVNLNSSTTPIHPLAKLELRLTPSEKAEAQNWHIPKPQNGHWLLLSAGIFYNRPQKKTTENFSGCYLWAAVL